MRRRLTLLSGLAVAISVVIASVIAYFAVAHQLRTEVDDSLRGAGRVGDRIAERVPFIRKLPNGQVLRLDPGPEIGGEAAPVPPYPPGIDGQQKTDIQGGTPPLPGPRLNGKLINSKGETIRQLGPDGDIPVDKRLFVEVALGKRKPTFTDVHEDGNHLRVYVQQAGNGNAFVSARTVDEIDDVLSQLKLLFLFVVLGGTAAAALLGRAVATASIAPITRLEEGARHVADTNDLTSRIEVGGPEETQSLAIQFNKMLEALEASSAALGASVESQRRLIADTSHELRTPITSLRTNIEVLHSVDRLEPQQRTELLNEVEGELEELGSLIEDVIELARGDEPGASVPEPEPVRLDTLVADVAGRVGRHWPGIDFEVDTEETRIQGTPDRIGRAVRNLLDNAAKWSPPGGTVDVTVRGGEIVVRDHGGGIPPEDLERIFDRFYRAPGAEGRPGSGLGLAIARQVADSHGGTVKAENAEGGGAKFTLALPA